jgi:hypothetical protein
MAIGKIDCTSDGKNLCNDYNVHSYPSLKFALNGVVHDYPGGREETALLQFAAKMSRPVVTVLHTVPSVYEQASIHGEDGVAFVAYHPAAAAASSEEAATATTVEEKLHAGGVLTQVYAQVARQEKAFGTFFLLETSPHPGASFGIVSSSSSSDDDETDNTRAGFVCRVEANVAPRCYSQPTDDEQVNLEGLLAFVRAQNVPTITQLGPANFHKIGNHGRALVIGVVHDYRETKEVSIMKKTLTDYATQGPPDIRGKYYYGWFDGKKWGKFLEQFGIMQADLPQIFVLDVPTKNYWQDSSYKLNVDDFLKAIEAGTIQSRRGGKKGVEGFVKRFLNVIVDYQPWSIIALVVALVVVLVAFAMLLSPATELRPPYPRSDGNPLDSTKEEKAAEDSKKESETKKEK